MGGELRQAQGHRGKAHAGQLVPLREVVAPRPEDRAVEEGLGPPPGQDRAEGAGAGRWQGRSGEGARGLRRRRGGAPDLAWSPAADMREGRRPPRGRRAVRGARPTVARVRVVPARGAGQGSREGVLIHARVARRRRQVPAHRRPQDTLRAGGSDLGYDPEARFRPQPDLTCAFSVGNDGAAPAYHERRSGGTADAGAFADLVSEAGLPGADCLAVADEGFASEGDLALLGELGLSCVVPPGRGNGFRGAGSRRGPPAGTTPSRTTGAGPAA